MQKHIMNEEIIRGFITDLRQNERAEATIQKYKHEIEMFYAWIRTDVVNKERVATYKEHLQMIGKAPISINAALAALHGFFSYIGWTECRVKYLKVQKRMFRAKNRELTKNEYERLVSSAINQGKIKLALVIETICATGIRVSELRYITVQALEKGKTEISMKGKIRSILLPNKLCRKLQKYAKKRKIASGEIFLTESGKSLSRHQIWSEMKALCNMAGVDASKVFPHNLRHLFARTFYRVYKDIASLADVLGHSSIETTRIYLCSTIEECSAKIENLKLVL